MQPEALRVLSEPPSCLEVAGLTKLFQRQAAIANVTFKVRPGEILGLLGENGAGKTTTLSCLIGRLRPDGGEMYWNGETLGPQNQVRVLALVPDVPEVYPMLTIWEHLAYIGAVHGQPKKQWQPRAEELLQRLNLAGRRHALGETLSRGMKGKLLLASAILADTPVLLLDEPIEGLDLSGQQEVELLLREARGRGKAIIVSTHLFRYLEPICDALLVLNRGQVAYHGSLDALKVGGRWDLEKWFLQLVSE